MTACCAAIIAQVLDADCVLNPSYPSSTPLAASQTKCDAVRPTCGACKRSQARAARGHALTAEVPPGPCTFPDDPATEDRAASKSGRNGSISSAHGNGHDPSYSDTRKSADASSASAGSSTTPNSNSNAFVSPSSGAGTSRPMNKHSSPQSKSGAAPGRSFVEIQSASGGPAKIQRFYQWSVSGDHPGMSLSNLVNPVIDPQLGGAGATKEEESSPQVDLLLRQMWPDLSPDLPTPTTIRHMAELFFSKHPLANMFVKPTMLARLMLPPNHPLRPHPSLLHAILAAAEPYSPLVPAMQDSNPLFPTGAAATGGAAEGSFPGFAPFDPQQSDSARAARVETSGRGFVGISNPMEMPRPDISKSLSFGEFHLGKARREVEVALLTQNQRPLEWLQAGVLIEYCLLERCRIMEAFFLSAALVRTLAPTGLDKMPNERQSDWWHRSLFGPPVSSILEYEQRMAVWQVYLCDTYGAGPPKFYEPCIADEKAQLTTTMPILMDPVEDDSALVLSEQTLASQDLFRSGHTDVFSVHVKSAVLLKRARTITSRRGIELQRMARPPEDILEIDRNAQEFIKTFPKREEREFDVDWIVAEANVCTARITLHQYFVGTGLDATSDYGRGPIEQATETMLRTIHLLLASSFDFHLLHTQTFVCWTVLIRVLDVKLRTLQRLPAALVAITGLAAGEIEKTRDSIEGVLAALTKAGTKSWRAKTSLDVSKTALEGDLTDDEFADMLFLYTTIPT